MFCKGKLDKDFKKALDEIENNPGVKKVEMLKEEKGETAKKPLRKKKAAKKKKKKPKSSLFRATEARGARLFNGDGPTVNLLTVNGCNSQVNNSIRSTYVTGCTYYRYY